MFIMLAARSLVVPVAAQTVPDGFSVETIHQKSAAKSTGFGLLPDGRVLVIGHHSGNVNLIVEGAADPVTVATIPHLAISSERGLLGVAVDPEFPIESYVYLYYTSDSGVNRVARYPVEGALSDPTSTDLTIDVAGEEILLEIVDDSEYHNAGTLRFGSDNTLYVSHGDDVKYKFWEEDELYLQDLTNLYGKILRINRDGSVPDDNPVFPSEPAGKRPEIFAVGLRNPFRFALDPETDRLFIGDVGTNLREEFNLSTGGENFGYPRHEGTGYFEEDADLITPNPTAPIYDYEYERPSHRTAVALLTYRPHDAPPDLRFPDEFDGAHFHADFFDDELRYLREDGNGGWESIVFGTGFYQLVDAALGPDGGIYILSYSGALRRITYSESAVATDDPPVASALKLGQNHPNPFQQSTVIDYELAEAGPVRLEVFDLLGRRVAVPVDVWQPAGRQTVRVDADGLAAGTYIYRLTAGASAVTKKMIRAPIE